MILCKIRTRQNSIILLLAFVFGGFQFLKIYNRSGEADKALQHEVDFSNIMIT